MAVIKSTFQVEVALSDEESFICVFKRKKQNQALDEALEMSKLSKMREESDDPEVRNECLRKTLDILKSSLVEVKGLELEDGTKVTADDFKSNEAYQDVINQTINAVIEHNSKGVDKQKKSSTKT